MHRYLRVLVVGLMPLLLALGLVAPGALALQAAEQATNSVAGTVGYFLEGEPYALVGATVALIPAADESGTPVATVTTGAEGVYLLDNIPAGDYRLRFSADPELWQTRYWSQASENNGHSERLFANAETITIPSETPLTSLDGYVDDATTSIEGTVSGPTSSTKIVGATVQLLAHGLGSEPAPVATVTTIAGGAFSFTDVDPGTYTLKASPGVLQTRYWDGASTYASADGITIIPGDHKDWFDLNLPSAGTSATGINGGVYRADIPTPTTRSPARRSRRS